MVFVYYHHEPRDVAFIGQPWCGLNSISHEDILVSDGSLDHSSVFHNDLSSWLVTWCSVLFLYHCRSLTNHCEDLIFSDGFDHFYILGSLVWCSFDGFSQSRIITPFISEHPVWIWLCFLLVIYEVQFPVENYFNQVIWYCSHHHDTRAVAFIGQPWCGHNSISYEDILWCLMVHIMFL